MYFDKYFPFYEAYASPLLYQGERMQEEEFELMKSYYPETVRRIQEQVEEECDLLDYEGSRLYDEYPDKYMFYHLCRKIRQRAEPELKVQSMDGSFLDEVSAQRPVIAKTGNGTSVVIVGYDEYNTWLYDPVKQEIYPYGMNDSTDLFQKAGNIFITYIESVNY